MLTIKDMLQDKPCVNEGALAELSDRLWEMGGLETIKEKVSPELFLLHIGANLIGNWQGDGWWFIICEQVDLVPYIPAALEALGLADLKAAFEAVTARFPEYTVFSSKDSSYYDIVNFLQSAHIKVSDERLKGISREKRKEMVTSVGKRLEALEALTEPLWGLDAEAGGWKSALDFAVKELGA